VAAVVVTRTLAEPFILIRPAVGSGTESNQHLIVAGARVVGGLEVHHDGQASAEGHVGDKVGRIHIHRKYWPGHRAGPEWHSPVAGISPMPIKAVHRWQKW